MKNFKSSMLQATFIIAAIIATSSCTTSKPEGSKEVAQRINEQTFENNNNSKRDAQFLVDAAAINREEISLGQLAQQKGGSSHVKELGKMMEVEHSKSLADLTALARKKNISLPTSQTENGKAAYEKLNEKSGNDFGKEYSGLMVKRHKDAIALFEKASTDSNDPEIRAWAAATLPALRTHLSQTLMCQEKCEKM
jgi:putative membrane protein